MKKILLILLFFATFTYSQFKEQPVKPENIKSVMVNSYPSNFLLGFINPNNLQMNHSFSMSYSSFGSQGVSLGVYTNSISYAFNKELNLEVDASFVNSPYSSFGEKHAKKLKRYLFKQGSAQLPSQRGFHHYFQISRRPLEQLQPVRVLLFPVWI